MASLDEMIANAAQRYGISPQALKAFVKIESGGDPNARTGSYRGLMQLSNQEFARHGEGGDINDPQANLNAGAAALQAKSLAFKQKYGREPDAGDLYLMHQQGEGGYAAHTANPGAPAWQNMLSTAEGRQKGPGWAKAAIWGNVPDDVKERYGSVENMTSQDFTNLWRNKVARFGGGDAVAFDSNYNQAVAQAPKPKEDGMIGLLSMLGQAGMAGGGLSGTAIPSMASAADGAGATGLQGLFGNMSAFGGGGKGGGDAGADDALASNAMKSAASGTGTSMQPMQKRPFDMQTLAKMLQSNPNLGALLRRGGGGSGMSQGPAA